MTATVDPFTVEVIRNALTAIAEEMSAVVMRSARSPLLREAGDLSSAITDATGELIAQGRDIPVHLGVMPATVKAFLERVTAARLAPGDVWLLNLPEVGGNHLPDVKAIRPVFRDGVLEAFAVSLAHWADVGGALPGSYVPGATDAWQEGLRIPPLRVFTADGPDQEKLDIVLANVRGADERMGDILAQMAATRTAEQRLGELYDRFGAATLRDAVEALNDQSEAQTRAGLAALPDGVYQGEDWLDDDGSGGPRVAIRVRITLGGGEATFDFSDSDDAVPGPLNTTRFATAASVYYAVKALAAPDVPPNAGCYRPITVITRPGSILEAPIDRPVVGGNHETAQRIVDAIVLALEHAIPERLTAGGPTTSGLLLFSGPHPRDGRWTTFYEPHGGGEGARADRDGMDVVRVHMSNVMNTPAEIVETEYPLRVERQALRRGSGGAGRHRGGDGLVRAYRVTGDGVALTTMVERRVVPPYGLQGGEPGAPYRITLERATGEREELPGKIHIKLAKGDLVIIETCGGGGYGVAT